MSPEYRVYIPNGIVDAFERFVTRSNGGKIISKNEEKRTKEPNKWEELDGFASRVRETIDQLPPDIEVIHLTHLGRTPPIWRELRDTLSYQENQLLGRATNVVHRHRIQTLSEVQKTDWRSKPRLRTEGEKVRALIMKIFPNQS